MVFVLGIVFFSVCAFFLLVSLWHLCLYIAFEKSKSCTGKTSGKLIRLKHKKNVPVYGRRYGIRGPIRLITVIKDLSKGRYEYTVNDKKCRVRLIQCAPVREMPLVADVVYLKIFPKIAYVKTLTNSHYFDIYSFGALMMAVMTALCGASCIFG